MKRYLTLIFVLIAKLLGWSAIWVFIALAMEFLKDQIFWPVPDGGEEWVDMLPTLITRVANYLILFFGHLAIVRSALLSGTQYSSSVYKGLELSILLSERRKGYLRNKTLGAVECIKNKVWSRVIGIALIWVALWTYLSGNIYFFCCSHFMGDQDAGDLPMWVDAVYPYVLYWVTIAASLVFYFAIGGVMMADRQVEDLK